MRKKILYQEIPIIKTTINKISKINKINSKISKDNKIKDNRIKTDKIIFKNKSLKRRNIHKPNKSNRRVLLNNRINLKQFNVINVRRMAITQIIVIKQIKKIINNSKIKQ